MVCITFSYDSRINFPRPVALKTIAFYHALSSDVFRTLSNIYNGTFCKNSEQILKYFVTMSF